MILMQVPLFNSVSACTWEPWLKKIFSQERECAYDQQFIEKWQGQSLSFINEVKDVQHIAVYDPFLYMKEPLHNNINMYKDIDHLNEYGCQFLIPSFSDAMDSFMADRKKKIRPPGQLEK